MRAIFQKTPLMSQNCRNPEAEMLPSRITQLPSVVASFFLKESFQQHDGPVGH